MSDSIVKPRNDLEIASAAVLFPTSRMQQEFVDGWGGKQFTATRLLGITELQSCDAVTTVAPILGAPMALLIAENLIASGAKRLMFFGIAGGLCDGTNEIAIGDIVFPRGAISEEGCSRHYGAEEEIHPPVSMLQKKLEQALLQQCVQAREGLIWSTDVPYRETAEKVQHYAERGALAVEMEYSALLQLCLHHDIEFAAAFVVSDLLAKEWIPGFRNKEFRRARASFHQALVSTIAALKNE